MTMIYVAPEAHKLQIGLQGLVFLPTQLVLALHLLNIVVELKASSTQPHVYDMWLGDEGNLHVRKVQLKRTVTGM